MADKTTLRTNGAAAAGEQTAADYANSPKIIRAFANTLHGDSVGAARLAQAKALLEKDTLGLASADMELGLRLARQDAVPVAGPQTFAAAQEAGDYGGYVANTLGSFGAAALRPQAAALVGGVLARRPGAFVGAAAGSFDAIRNAEMNTIAGDAQLSTLGLREQVNLAESNALKQSAFEALLPTAVARGLPNVGRLSGTARAVGTIAGEAGTEAIQDVISQTGQQGYFPDRQMDWDSVRESAIAGAVGGAAAAPLVRSSTPAPAPVVEAPPGGTPPTPPPIDPTPQAPQTPPLAEPSADNPAPEDAVDRVVRQGNFEPPIEQQLDNDLLPEAQDPEVQAAVDPAAALLARDAKVLGRAQQYADTLLNDPATPESTRQFIASLNGDYSDSKHRTVLMRAAKAQKAGADFVKAAAKLVNYFAPKATDDTKFNLQEIADADAAPLVALLAPKLGPAADQAPTLAKQLIAMSRRMNTQGVLTQGVARDMRAFADVVDDEVLRTVGTLSKSEALEKAIARVRAIPSAVADVKRAGPKSFLASVMVTAAPREARQIAEVVDELGLQTQNITPARAARNAKALELMAPYFGSVERAKVVVDYYGKLQRDAFEKEATANTLPEDRPAKLEETKYIPDAPRVTVDPEDGGKTTYADELGTLTERDEEVMVASYRDPISQAPFFRGTDSKELLKARRDTPGGTVATMGEYVQRRDDQPNTDSDSPEYAIARIRSMIEKRVRDSEARDTDTVQKAIASLSLVPEAQRTPEIKKMLNELQNRKTDVRTDLPRLRKQKEALDAALGPMGKTNPALSTLLRETQAMEGMLTGLLSRYAKNGSAPPTAQANMDELGAKIAANEAKINELVRIPAQKGAENDAPGQADRDQQKEAFAAIQGVLAEVRQAVGDDPRAAKWLDTLDRVPKMWRPDPETKVRKPSAKDPTRAALDKYAVVMKPLDETYADDDQLGKFRELLDKKPNPNVGTPEERAKKKAQREAIEQTALYFELANGKTFVLSAESMVHEARTRGTVKERFLDAFASVMARRDVERFVPPDAPEDVIILRRDGNPLMFNALFPKGLGPGTGSAVALSNAPVFTTKAGAKAAFNRVVNAKKRVMADRKAFLSTLEDTQALAYVLEERDAPLAPEKRDPRIRPLIDLLADFDRAPAPSWRDKELDPSGSFDNAMATMARVALDPPAMARFEELLELETGIRARSRDPDTHAEWLENAETAATALHKELQARIDSGDDGGNLEYAIQQLPRAEWDAARDKVTDAQFDWARYLLRNSLFDSADYNERLDIKHARKFVKEQLNERYPFDFDNFDPNAEPDENVDPSQTPSSLIAANDNDSFIIADKGNVGPKILNLESKLDVLSEKIAAVDGIDDLQLPLIKQRKRVMAQIDQLAESVPVERRDVRPLGRRDDDQSNKREEPRMNDPVLRAEYDAKDAYAAADRTTLEILDVKALTMMNARTLRATLSAGRPVKTSLPSLAPALRARGYIPMPGGVWELPEPAMLARGFKRTKSGGWASQGARDPGLSETLPTKVNKLGEDYELSPVPSARTKPAPKTPPKVDRPTLSLKRSAVEPGDVYLTTAQKREVIDELVRTRGPDIEVLFRDMQGSSGSYQTDEVGMPTRLVTVSLRAANPVGVAQHEALHDFFAELPANPDGRSIKRDIAEAVAKPHVMKELHRLLDGHPDAQAQARDIPEEAAAYAYQFWSEGLLKLDLPSTNLFRRVANYFRKLLNLVSVDERAAQIFAALKGGKFADMSTVSEVLADMPADRVRNKFERALPPIKNALDVVFKTAPDRLRDFQSPALDRLADLFSSETGELGYIQKQFQQSARWRNKLERMLDGTTAEERRAALESLQKGKPVAERNALETTIGEFLQNMHTYMTEARVTVWRGETTKTTDPETSKQRPRTLDPGWRPIRWVADYFPRNWDAAAINADRAGFRELIKKHSGMDADRTERLIARMTAGTGQQDIGETDEKAGFTPFAPNVKERALTFINASNAAEFAKYQSKDLVETLMNYAQQATQRAEYSRAFGPGGRVIGNLIADSGLKREEDLAAVVRTVQGLEGSLGSRMTPQLKEIMSWTMTLQNLVILPLAIVSQMIDPIVLAARSGDIRDAGEALITAVRRIAGERVYGEEMAETLGIIAQDSVMEAMGMAYGSVQATGMNRRINQLFFKYNGMQGWNNSMRIAATVTGEKYLIANAKNEDALRELGLQPADVTHKDGRLDEAALNNERVQQAFYRFVDSAVIRPSASNRPVWMSDPRFLLVSHLKQFTFAMHNVVLKRASKQLGEGNHRPWSILMAAMPVILAADIGKFALTGGAPAGWGAMDFLQHAVERSGLLGLGDFGVQATKGVETGLKAPGESLLGPTFEHLMTILRGIIGSPGVDAGDVVDRTVPGARFLPDTGILSGPSTPP